MVTAGRHSPPQDRQAVRGGGGADTRVEQPDEEYMTLYTKGGRGENGVN